MNDYSIGAIEALSWVRAILKKCNEIEMFIKARKEIEDMLLRLASGAAVDFKRKTDYIEVL